MSSGRYLEGLRNDGNQNTELALRPPDVCSTCTAFQCEPSTLAKRQRCTGPAYRLIGGKAMYLDEDIDGWALTLISQPRRKASDATSTQLEAVA